MQKNCDLNTTFVSLQLENICKHLNCKIFKYNFCFSSTVMDKKIIVKIIKFKYNFCFSSTGKENLPVPEFLIFKYNFCFSSTKKKD